MKEINWVTISGFVWECYHDNARLSHRFTVKAGLLDGPYEEFDRDGRLVEEEIFNKNWAWPMDNQRWNEFGESRRRFEDAGSEGEGTSVLQTQKYE